MKVLYLNGHLPETPEFLVPGFSRAGNLACSGIGEGLLKVYGDNLTCLGVMPVQSWPRYPKLLLKRLVIEHDSGLKVQLIPSVNLRFLRELLRGIYAFFYILNWARRCHDGRRYVILYNFYSPPVEWVQWACRLSRTLFVPIAFDIGIPPHDTGLIRMFLHHVSLWRASHSLARVRRACVITDEIQKRYMRGAPAFLLDGGISDQVVAQLPPLDRSATDGSVVAFMTAGSLRSIDGVELTLAAIKKLTDVNLRFYFAGKGACVNLIQKAARTDPRIVYLGSLELRTLLKQYVESDVLLNIRLTQSVDTSTWFPSKFFELMAAGRLVLTTNVGHIKDVYGDYCSVLEEETPEALAARMKELANLTREERDARGASARTFILESHNWNVKMRRAAAFIEEEFRNG